MGVIGRWRAARERKRRAANYLRALLTPPDPTDVAWLTTLTGDRSVAVRELTFARRVIGLIVAERDALDDRTASDVARALSDVIDRDTRSAVVDTSLWTARRKAYTVAMAVRGHREAPTVRLGRVLLEGAGVAHPSDDALAGAAQFVQSTRAQANETLRAVFGEASLPEDVRPSAIRP